MKIRNAAKLLLIGFLSTPGVGFGETTAQNPDDVCSSISQLAQHIMTARQNGAPMSEMMGIVSKFKIDDKRTQAVGLDILREMVISAYDAPRFSGAKYQARQIQDFRDATYLACVKGQAKASK